MSENLEKIRPVLVALEVGESVSFPHFTFEKRPYTGLRAWCHLQPSVQDQD